MNLIRLEPARGTEEGALTYLLYLASATPVIVTFVVIFLGFRPSVVDWVLLAPAVMFIAAELLLKQSVPTCADYAFGACLSMMHPLLFLLMPLILLTTALSWLTMVLGFAERVQQRRATHIEESP